MSTAPSALDYALQLFADQRHEQALSLLKLALQQQPQDSALWNLHAVCALRSGNPAQAEQSWRRAIDCAPDNALLQLNLALLLSEQNRLPEALSLSARALATGGAQALVQFNVGVIREKAGQLDAACEAYETAAALDPNHHDALFNLGVVQGRLERHAQAESAYRRALKLQPQHLQCRVNLGVILCRLQRFEEAEACLRQALQQQQDQPEALRNLGGLLMRQNRRAEADQLFREAGDAHSIGARLNLALLLQQRGDYAGAERELQQALALEPTHLSSLLAMGELLGEQNEDAAALDYFRRAMQADPDSALPLGATAQLLAQQGREQEAEQWFARAIAQPRDAQRTQAVYAAFQLMQGRFESGFAAYEVRLAAENHDGFQPPPNTDRPRWTGQPLTGRVIVIWPEQGYGDQIQFCRYARALKALGAARVIIVSQAPLVSLLASTDGVDESMSLAQFQTLAPQFDYWTYVMSLAHFCGPALGWQAQSVPYLHADAARIAHWRQRLPEAGLRVALAWKGSKGHHNDARRSLRHLRELAPLWSVPDVSFISLQKGQGEDEIAAQSDTQPLLALGAEIKDFADTAAILMQVDLLISVDTAVAHLCGALGRPCDLLLADKVDWRWQRAQSQTRWYPQMQLFRQVHTGDWQAPVMALQCELMRLVKKGAS